MLGIYWTFFTAGGHNTRLKLIILIIIVAIVIAQFLSYPLPIASLFSPDSPPFGRQGKHSRMCGRWTSCLCN